MVVGLADRPLRVTFIVEQQVGLKTYTENLRRFIDLDERVAATWRPITYIEEGGVLERLPLVPASLSGTLRGRLQVREACRKPCDARLYLTQTPVAISGRLARQRPYVIVVDDTPILLDDMSAHYQLKADRGGPLSKIKHRLNCIALTGAGRVLPLSEWARQSLVDDYGVDESRTLVVPIGLDLDVWKPGAPHDGGPMRILFVGGDFERKGGPSLVDAARRLPSGSYEVHVVTRSDVAPSEDIIVHRGLEQNSEPLLELYRSSDVFVLPSLAEAYPNVVMEAAASGLPAVVTRVGGMAEMVEDGVTGFVLPPGDTDALHTVLEAMRADPERRKAMSHAARQRAEERFDGRKTADAVIRSLLDAAGRR